MFSFLNFSFDSPTRDGRENSKARKNGPEFGGGRYWRSDSNTTSPTSSSAGTPKRIPLLCTPPPMKPPREAPSARPAVASPTRGPRGHNGGGVRKRRSSIFFKLPDIDKVRKGRSSHGRRENSSSKAKARDKVAPTTADTEQDQQQQQQLPAKLTRPTSRRRSRRASVAPVGGSPIRTRALHSPFGTTTETEKDNITLKQIIGCEDLPVGSAAAAAAAAAAGAAVAAEGFCSKDTRKYGGAGS
ncbi:unnamed protein product, partial [Laminaria digitata]